MAVMAVMVWDTVVTATDWVMVDTATVWDTVVVTADMVMVMEDMVATDVLDMTAPSVDVFTMVEVMDVEHIMIIPLTFHHTPHLSTLVQMLHQFMLVHTSQLFMLDLMYQASITEHMLHCTMLDHMFLSFTCHHLSTQFMLDQWAHQYTLPHHLPSTINHQSFTINLTSSDTLLTTTSDIMLELEVIMEATMDQDTGGEVMLDMEAMVATDMVVTVMASVLDMEQVTLVVMVAWVVMMVNAVKQEVMVMDSRELSNKNDRSKLKAVVPSDNGRPVKYFPTTG